jgi:hypothetical protein
VLSAFGVGFFYRVVLPGILTVFLLGPLRPPGLGARFGLSGIGDKTTWLVVAILGIGLFLSSARQFIYYLLEGFYWLPWAGWQRAWRDYTIRRAHRRYQELEAKRAVKTLSPREELRQSHIIEFLNDFPIETGDSVSYVVDRPT